MSAHVPDRQQNQPMKGKAMTASDPDAAARQRKVYVWRLNVIRDGQWREGGTVSARRYLSRRGAEHRAAVIRDRGGEVTVERSEAVEWLS